MFQPAMDAIRREMKEDDEADARDVARFRVADKAERGYLVLKEVADSKKYCLMTLVLCLVLTGQVANYAKSTSLADTLYDWVYRPRPATNDTIFDAKEVHIDQTVEYIEVGDEDFADDDAEVAGTTTTTTTSTTRATTTRRPNQGQQLRQSSNAPRRQKNN
jgi:hypothetical protein